MQLAGGGFAASGESALNAKILVVDDRQDKLLVFESILQELKQTIFTARSGEEALKLVLEHEFAVVLLDVNMPGLDGFETAALIRKRRKTAHVPIIFVTSYSDEMLTAQGYSLGAVDYILSPVVPEILRTKVKVFVDLFCLSQSAKRQAEERIALASEHAARAAAEEANRRSSLLAEASRVLSGSLDVRPRVQELFSIVVPALADYCSFTPVDEEGRIGHTDLTWARPNGPPGTASTRAIPPALAESVERAIATRKPQKIANRGTAPTQSNQNGSDPAELAFEMPICSMSIFPLIARRRMVGVLSFALFSHTRVFNDSDWSLMEDLANRAAVALDNAYLFQQLQNADHQKNEFLAMLGHELRNPLAAIRNAVEVSRIPRLDISKLNWVQGIIERQIEHLMRLVDDLLDVSRITRGTIELQLASLTVSSVVSAAVESSSPLIESRRHRLTVSTPPETLWIKADAVRLAQVLGNLLNNASKYTPEGGSISMTVIREGDQVVFRVTDTGLGLSEEIRSRMFDLFAQGDVPPNSLREGLGVGLTVVRRLVELHGGSVNAFSEGLNKGSEFTVSLPLLHEEEIESANSPASAPDPGQASQKILRVLVVDDNDDVAQSTGLMLQLAGFEVELACDGPAALKAVSDFHPDAVLLDIGLPIMDGYEVARRLRAQPSGEQLVILAISGYGQKHNKEDSTNSGFDSYLIKPIDPSHLVNLLLSVNAPKN